MSKAAMTLYQFFLCTFMICFTSGQQSIRDFVIEKSCCAANLMDSADKIVIDFSSSTEGTFVGLKVLLCTVTPTTVQLWQPIGSSEMYTLIFQRTISAEFYGFQWVPFEQPIKITPDIKIGFRSPGNDKLGPPYEYDNSGLGRYVTYISFDSYGPNESFEVGDSIRVDDLVFPRSFHNSFFYCSSLECPEEDQFSAEPMFFVGPKGATGPPGPPGPAGQGCSDINFDDPFFKLAQDPVISGMNSQISSVKDDTATLITIIANLTSRIFELNQANFITGTCPVGFVSGSYGVGACYYIHRSELMSFGEAQLYCRTKFAGSDASLIDIRSDLEDNFVRNHITTLIQQTGDGVSEVFWTAGMYSSSASQWIWYDEIVSLQNTLNYENFISSADKDTDRMTKRCLSYVVDPTNNRSWWRSDFCEVRHFVICKVLKKCL